MVGFVWASVWLFACLVLLVGFFGGWLRGAFFGLGVWVCVTSFAAFVLLFCVFVVCGFFGCCLSGCSFVWWSCVFVFWWGFGWWFVYCGGC